MPNVEVEILTHPHPAAIEESKATRNVQFVTQLVGHYDVLLATDVFEHVHDPLALVESTARHLKVGGKYLIANSFWPVIKCHLPQRFHFRNSWCAALNAMGLKPEALVILMAVSLPDKETLCWSVRALWRSRQGESSRGWSFSQGVCVDL